MDNIYVYLVDLPHSISECVTPCYDGYTVYLNSRLSQKRQHEAYNHALGHIYNHDWEKTNADEIEAVAHENY